MRSLFGTATGLFPLRYVNDVGACIAEEIILIGLVRAKQQQAVGAGEKFGHGVTVPGCALSVEVGSGFVEEYEALFVNVHQEIPTKRRRLNYLNQADESRTRLGSVGA